MTRTGATARAAHAEPAPSRNLGVVPRRGRALRVGVVAVALFGVVLLFGLVGFHALIVRNQSRIDDLQARISEADDVNQRLRFEIAGLGSPERIRAVAIDQMGMVVPERVEYLEPISAAALARGDGASPVDDAGAVDGGNDG